MRHFQYTVRDELGIHARPAGLLVKAAGKYKSSTVILEKDGIQADMKKLFRVMGLTVKQGDAVTVSVEGEDEGAAIAEIMEIFEKNL